jgi:hypothetical protein
MSSKDFSALEVNHPCAFCVSKFIRVCQLCPEWPEELLDPEILTTDFMEERARLLDKPSFTSPFSH